MSNRREVLISLTKQLFDNKITSKEFNKQVKELNAIQMSLQFIDSCPVCSRSLVDNICPETGITYTKGVKNC